MTLITILLLLSLITLVAATFNANLRNINLVALGLAFFVASVLTAAI